MDANERRYLERILESAAILSWADLVRNTQADLIQIEYGFAAGGTLKHVLQTVMQHQAEFSLPVDLGRQGLLHIATPTQQESIVASALINETLRHLGALAELTSA